MENSILKKDNLLQRDSTNGKVIPLFPKMPTNNIIDNEDDSEKIVIHVPKGFNAKIILEKKENHSTEIQSSKENFFDNNNNEFFGNNIEEELATTSTYDIIKTPVNSGIFQNSDNTYSKKEGVYMKKSVMYDVLKVQIKFLLVAVAFILFSITGLAVFYRTGFYVIHPIMYIFTLIMGIGWGSTALVSIKSNKV